MSAIEVGELLFEYTLNITRTAEYGASMEELMAGKISMPREGVRTDAHFEGPVTGEKVQGTAQGVDYLWLRPDGRMEVNIHSELTTEDGQQISLKADGVSFARTNSSIFDIRANITLFSSHKNFTWMNPLQVWGIGSVDLATQLIHMKAYSALPADIK